MLTRLHIGDEPKGTVQGQFLFNQYQHRILQGDSDAWWSFIGKDKKGKILAEIHGFVENEILSSPHRAPFGGFFGAEELPSSQVYEFLESWSKELKTKGIKEIIVKSPPEVYSNHMSRYQDAVYPLLGFELQGVDPHWVIPVRRMVPFHKGLHSPEFRRKLRFLHENKFVFSVDSLSESNEVYSFLESCMVERGYTLSMSREEMMMHTTLNAENMMLFSVKFNGQRVASAVCFRGSGNILYDYVHVHDSEFHSKIPMIMLVEGMYTFCNVKGYRYLDLGACSLQGLPNFPLIRFKESLGARPSSKYIWRKTFP